MQKDFLINSLLRCFNKKKIHVDSTKFAFYLKSHPKYPQITSAIETLQKFEIDFSIYETSFEELPSDLNWFMALLRDDKDELFLSLIENGSQSNFSVNTIQEEAPLDLSQKWAGLVIVIDDNFDLQKKYKTYQLRIWIIALLLILSSLLISRFHALVFVFMLVSLVGIVLSIFVHREIFNLTGSFSEKVCKSINKGKCNSVTKTKKWKLFKVLDFSDLSLVFFSSQAISLTLISVLNEQNGFFSFQRIVLLFSIPLILTSIYYQKNVVREWCVICLFIILLLVFKIFIVFGLDRSFNIPYDLAFFYLIIFGFGLFLWKTFKRVALKKYSFEDSYLNLSRTAKSYPVFKFLLENGKRLDTKKDYLILKENKTKPELILITDPFCDHCKSMHFEFKELNSKTDLALHPSLVFNIDLDEEAEIDRMVYQTMTYLNRELSPEEFQNIMDQWFTMEKRELWLEKFSTQFNKAEIDFILKQQHNWCKRHNLDYTPVLLFNSYLLPNIYKVEDLQHFVNTPP